jgi:cell division septal protein FtsQ
MRKIFNWLTAGVIFLFLFLQAWQFFVSLPAWKLNDVNIKGNIYWSRDFILEHVEIPFGESIFKIDLKDLEAQFLELPQFQEVKLSRKVPDELSIEILERSPGYKVRLDGKIYIIGIDGVLMDNYTNEIIENARLITLRGFNSLPEIEKYLQTFIPAFNVLKAVFPKEQLVAETMGVYDMQCLVADNLLIKWGNDEQLMEKEKVLKNIRPIIEDKWSKVMYIDVRSPRNLAIRYKTR